MTNQFSLSRLGRAYALYDYDGSINNNNKSLLNRFSDRHIKVNEGDELEVIEDDDEHMWKVKNLRTNEIGLIPATLVRMVDGDLSKSIHPHTVSSHIDQYIVCSDVHLFLG